MSMTSRQKAIRSAFEAEYPIAEVVLFDNGMVACFDRSGKPMPEFQGPLEEVREDILMRTFVSRFPGGTEFYRADWKKRTLARMIPVAGSRML